MPPRAMERFAALLILASLCLSLPPAAAAAPRPEPLHTRDILPAGRLVDLSIRQNMLAQRIMQMMDAIARQCLESGATAPLASAAPSSRN